MNLYSSWKSLVGLTIMTSRSLLQQKTLLLLVVFACFFLAGTSLLTRFSFEDGLSLFCQSTLGLFSFFLSMGAVVATALVFSLDRKTPGLLLLLSKPLPRYYYLLGRLLGVFLFLSVLTLFVSTLFFVLLLARELSAWKTLSVFSLRSFPVIEASLFAGSISKIFLFKSILLILLQSWVLSAATMFIAVMASSSFFSIGMGLLTYFIGHLKAGLITAAVSSECFYEWSHQVLKTLLLLFPDLSIFEVGDFLQVKAMITNALLFHAASRTFFYVFFYFLSASFLFQRREF